MIRCGGEALLGIPLRSPLSSAGEGPLEERGAGRGSWGVGVLHMRLRTEDSDLFPFICLCAVGLKSLLSLCYIQCAE